MPVTAAATIVRKAVVRFIVVLLVRGGQVVEGHQTSAHLASAAPSLGATGIGNQAAARCVPSAHQAGGSTVWDIRCAGSRDQGLWPCVRRSTNDHGTRRARCAGRGAPAMTTITPGGLTADRVAVEARPDVEDRFLFVALANVAVAILFSAIAIANDLPAALGVEPDRLRVTSDAMTAGTALSAPLPLIVLFALATMVALQGGRGRKVAAGACALYGALTT
ncbi:hypothetical protein B7486_57145, partial [cyanobacterium TDX16]